MQKAELRLDVHCEEIKKKAMKTVCGLSGVNSVDMKDDGKLTVTGDIDVYAIVKKLKKVCHTDIVTVGPVKEQEKKPKPPEPEPRVIYVPQYPPNHCFNECVYENPNNCVII